MLYEFKNNYPEININQFLSKTSPYFQRYVSDGLKAVQAEKDGELMEETTVVINSSKSGHVYFSRIILVLPRYVQSSRVHCSPIYDLRGVSGRLPARNIFPIL